MKKYDLLRLLLVGLVAMCLLVPGVVLAQDEDDEETPVTEPIQINGAFATERLDWDSRDVGWISRLIGPPTRPPEHTGTTAGGGVRGNTASLDWDSRSAMIPGELADPAFDRYVNLLLLGQAWAKADSGLMTDVALQLAEGERILMRSHKAISADKVMKVAIRMASEKGNKSTLDRLSKVVAKRDNPALKTQIATAVKLSGEARAINPAMLIQIATMSPEAFAIYRSLLLAIEKLRIAGDAGSLESLEDSIKDVDGLSEKQQENLLKLISETRSTMSKDAKPDPSIEVLEKLSHAARPRMVRTRRNPQQGARIAAGILQIIAAALEENGDTGGGGGVVVQDGGQVIFGGDNTTTPDSGVPDYDSDDDD